MTTNIGSLTFVTPMVRIEILDSSVLLGFPLRDRYLVSAFDEGDFLETGNLVQIILINRDPDPLDVITSDALPLTPPDPDLFAFRRFFFNDSRVSNPTVGLRFLGSVDSVTPIPEPGTLLLLGSGVAFLAAKSRKRIKNRLRR